MAQEENFQWYYDSPDRSRRRTGPWNTLAVISSIAGVLSFAALHAFWHAAGLGLGLAGLLIPAAPMVLGFISLEQLRESNGKGRGLAIVGIILGMICSVLLLASIFMFVLLFRP